MFISGYLLLYSYQKYGVRLVQVSLLGGNGFLIKKIKRLLIPYMAISTLAFFPKAYLSRFADRPVSISLQSWIEMLIYPQDNVIGFFWFLPTLFIITCMVMGAVKLSMRLRITFNIYLILLFLLILHVFNPVLRIPIFNIASVVNYLFYFALGMFYCFKQEKINKKLYLKNYQMSIVIVLLSIICMYIHGIGTDVLKALIGIMMSISLGYLYIQCNFTFFNHLFGASYAIYLFSWFPQTASQQAFLKLTHAPWEVSTILAIVTGIYIPFFIYKFIIFAKKNIKYGKVIALLTGHG
jgi:hypothetical protein